MCPRKVNLKFQKSEIGALIIANIKILELNVLSLSELNSRFIPKQEITEYETKEINIYETKKNK